MSDDNVTSDDTGGKDPVISKHNMAQASGAYAIANAMCAYRCARHHGDDDAKEWDTLHLDDVDVPGVLGALCRMVEMQYGEPLRIEVEQSPDGAWELAEHVAEGAKYDRAMFTRATAAGMGREQLWQASQAFKPEDDPGWADETD
jgi:hypothetical protein